jgi:hypothetical protein
MLRVLLLNYCLTFSKKSNILTLGYSTESSVNTILEKVKQRELVVGSTFTLQRVYSSVECRY